MIIFRSPQHTGKTWTIDADGRPVEGQTHYPSLWRVAYEQRVDESWTIKGVLDLLQRLERDPTLKLQMGRLTDKARAALERGESIRRQGFDTSNPDGTTRDDLECLLVIDLDAVPWAFGYSLDDGEQAIKALVDERAPQLLKDVDFVYQHTGSAGFTKNGAGGAFLRLFFLCSPTTQAEIKERVETGLIDDKGKLFDLNLYRPNQSINTAPPRLLRGLADPVAQRGLSRSGLITGVHRRVELPQIVHTRDERQQEERSKDSRPCSRGFAARQLENKIKTLESLGDGRWTAARATARYLGGLIESGLDEEDVITQLVNACVKNGCIRRGRSRSNVEKMIRSGVLLGKTEPITLTYEGTEGTTNARGRRARALSRSTDEQPNPRTYAATRAPSSPQEIALVVEQALSRAVLALEPDAQNALTAQDKLVLLRVAAGAGKSHALTRLVLEREDSADLAAQAIWRWRRRCGVVIAFKTYGLLSEAEARLRAGGLIDLKNANGEPESEVYQVVRGRMRRCELWVGDDLTDDDERQQRRREIEGADEMKLLGPTFCTTCPHAQNCDLRRGRGGYPPLVGRLTLMTHAMLAHLARFVRSGDDEPLVLLDEAPATTFEATATLSDLSCFSHKDATGADDADAAWRQRNLDAADLVQRLTTLIEEEVASVERRAPKKSALYLDAVISHLEPVRLNALRSLAERVRASNPSPPTEEDEKRAQERIERLRRKDPLLITQPKIDLLLALVAVLLDDKPLPLLALKQGQEINLSSWRRFKLPAGAPVLLADATPDEARWEMIAKADGRLLHKERAELTSQPLKVLIWRTMSLSRSSMFDRSGALSKTTRETLGALSDSLSGFLGSSSEPVAVGCHFQQLAKAIREALNANEGDSHEMSDHRLTRLLGARPVEVGYTGADGVGSNRFEEAAVLLLLSDPWAHLLKHEGEERALAALTGHEAPTREALDSAYLANALRTSVQWVGRLRHLRQPNKRAVIAGAIDPEVIAQALLDAFGGELIVEVVGQPERTPKEGRDYKTAPRGGRDTDPNTDEAREVIRSLLGRGVSLTQRDACEIMLADPKDASALRVARRLLAEVKREIEVDAVAVEEELDAIANKEELEEVSFEQGLESVAEQAFGRTKPL